MEAPALRSPSELLAPKVHDLFFDANGAWIPSRYKVMHGGRAGMRTWGFARVAVCMGVARKVRFLCTREVQNSIDESVHHSLEEQISILGLEAFFEVDKYKITSYTGSEYVFRGLQDRPRKLKSLEAFDVCWVEEGEKISKAAWEALTPTLRAPSSEIWVAFNPDLESDPTSQRFLVHPPPKEGPPAAVARIIETNWRDNPWLSDELRAEKDYLASVDMSAYEHVWEGKYRANSKSQVLAGKYTVAAFTAEKDWHGPYQGADWGFSQDPTTFVRCWIHGAKLYVEHEAWAIGRDIDKTPALFDQVPDARKHVTRADNARPETVRYLQTHGYPRLVSVEKWAGSVEDGIAFLRQFEQIVIHPRCTHTMDEAKHYSYKIDRLSADVLPEVVDANNHCIDAIRYALQPLIRAPNTGFLTFMQQQVEAMNKRKAAEAAGSSSQ